MSQNPIHQLPVRTAGPSQALLGARHGYRFEGDTVHLTAMFTVITPAAHNRAWALQLWACPTAPATRAELETATLHPHSIHAKAPTISIVGAIAFWSMLKKSDWSHG